MVVLFFYFFFFEAVGCFSFVYHDHFVVSPNMNTLKPALKFFRCFKLLIDFFYFFNEQI